MSGVVAAILLLVQTASAIPPLTAGQIAELSGSIDGTELRDSGFDALLQNMKAWQGGIGDAPVRMNMDLASLRNDPRKYRGDVFLIEGTLNQRSSLLSTSEQVEEWFIRNQSGVPFLVFVLDPDAKLFREGNRIEMHARFYKTMTITSRDGQARIFPAFVGAHPRLQASPIPQDAVLSRLWLIAGPMAAMAIALIILRMRVRARRSIHPTQAAHPRLTDALDDQPPLPDDPAEALAELKRRAEK